MYVNDKIARTIEYPSDIDYISYIDLILTPRDSIIQNGELIEIPAYLVYFDTENFVKMSGYLTDEQITTLGIALISDYDDPDEYRSFPPPSRLFESFGINYCMYFGDCTKKYLTEKTTEFDCGRDCTIEYQPEKTEYDYLLNLFENYEHMEIFKKTEKHEFYESDFLEYMDFLKTEESGWMPPDAEIAEMRKDMEEYGDGSVDHTTMIFLSKFSIYENMYEKQFFYDKGIGITIIPKEELTEEELTERIGSYQVEFNLNENVKGYLSSYVSSVAKFDNPHVSSYLKFVDDENLVTVRSSLSYEQLITLGLALN